jgi:lipopolysaccharide assembly outer membrane protein LptD (OstA)
MRFMMFHYLLRLKICTFFAFSLYFSVPCAGQSLKGDTAARQTPPVKPVEKISLKDTSVANKALPAQPSPVSDTVGLPGKTPPDSTAKKKDSELADTVFYGTEGGYIDYDVERKTMRLIHQATVKYQNITLFADTIIYRIDESIFDASGKPQLVEGQDTTIGEAMIYNIKTRRGRVRYASTHMNDAFFNGKNIIKSDNNELYVDQGDYTTCAKVESPHYFFYGKHIKLIPEDKIIGRPVIFAVGEAPVAALPYFIFPIKKNRTSGMLTPIWGGHPESGGYVDHLGYYWAFNDYVDLEVSGRVQEFQQFVANASTHYSKKYDFSGAFSGRYTLNNNFLQQNKQWAIDYSHDQKLTPDGNLTLSGRGSLVSAQNFYKNFSEDSTELLNQSMTANMSMVKRFESINASGSVTWNRSQNLKTSEKIEDAPSISFSLPSRAIIPFQQNENSEGGENKEDEAKWYNNITYSYNAQGIQRIQSSNVDTAYSQRREIAQNLSLSSPFKLFQYFTVNPNFSARAFTFDNYMDTAAYDSVDVFIKTYDTVSIQQVVKDTFPVVDTLTDTYDRVHAQYDTTYKRLKSTTKYRAPLFHKYRDKWSTNTGWNAGISASTILYGVYPVNMFGFVGIRHTLTPSIGYSYQPKKVVNKRYFDLIGNEGSHDKAQTINLSLNNQFQGKTVSGPAKEGEKPPEKKFQILDASLGTGYNFEAKERKWGNLSANASTGYSIFRLTYSSDFWLYNGQGQLSRPLLHSYTVNISPDALSAHGTLWEGDKIVANGLYPKDDVTYANAGPQAWQLTVSPSYSFSSSRASLTEPFVSTKNYNLNASASLNFTRRWSVSWSSYYNFVTNQMVGHNLHFHCDLECWDMVFDYQPAGSYNAGYYFKVNIKKVPEIFWEKRD